MTQIKGVIFDLDGTLTSTNELIFDSFNHIAEIYHGKRYTEAEIIELFGPTEEGVIYEWMKDKADSAIKDYMEFYFENHEAKVKAFEGMEECIQLVKEKGKNPGIFTGKGRRTTDITLAKLDFEKYFELIVTGDDVVNHKPAPDGILKYTKKYNLKPEEVLMIGDAPADIIASRGAGCKVASLLWDSYAVSKIHEMKPDYKFNSVSELKEFLKTI